MDGLRLQFNFLELSFKVPQGGVQDHHRRGQSTPLTGPKTCARANLLLEVPRVQFFFHDESFSGRVHVHDMVVYIFSGPGRLAILYTNFSGVQNMLCY